MNTITIICLCIIICAFIFSLLYVKQVESKNKLIEKRRVIDSLPSIISTLGVLGTFIGITIGLMDFSTKPTEIDSSIATLLGGLKTAFFTSLAGMLGSLILRGYTDTLFDKKEEGASTAELAATVVCKQIKEMSQQMVTAIQHSTESTQNMLSEIKNIESSQVTFFNSVQSQLNRMNSANIDAMNTNFETLVLLSRSQESSLRILNTHMEKMLDTANINIGISREQLSETKKYSEALKYEVDSIKTKMAETNQLLTAKFDEFSELLKKSNTEALVSVMKNVTEEFQKQMNSLINKLIQENFEQLNQSVDRLNVWQQENKEMISSLTAQYKQMANEFNGTSESLTKVSSDTKQLVSDGGRLSLLIEQLNKVMIDDKKFVEIASKLESTVSLTKNNMQQFDESTTQLNKWVNQHKNFVEEVEKLVTKLDELNKIRDYNEKFWEDTKRGMSDGVAIIEKGTESLNSQLTELDKKFYTRLSTTLAELDVCIQAMVNGKTK